MRNLLPVFVLATVCACSSGPTPKPEPAPVPPRAAASGESLPQSMREHFADATAARDAVISGRLEAVRPPLQRLAASEPSPDMPMDWRPWVDEMRAQARAGAQAPSLEAAARAVAALGGMCGECHRTTAGGEHKPRHVPSYAHGDRKGLQEKMARHKFAADALWRGLTGPLHEAWAQGAAALMNIRVPGLVGLAGTSLTTEREPSGQGELEGDNPHPEPVAQTTSQPRAGVIDLDAALRELRALGEQADRAAIASEKQAVFAQIIVRCGDCHERAGVRL